MCRTDLVNTPPDKYYKGSQQVNDCIEMIFSGRGAATLVCGLPAGETHGDTDYHDGSDDESDCVCTPGHTGPNNGPCCACKIGTFKPTLGSGLLIGARPLSPIYIYIYDIDR